MTEQTLKRAIITLAKIGGKSFHNASSAGIGACVGMAISHAMGPRDIALAAATMLEDWNMHELATPIFDALRQPFYGD